MAQLLLGLDVGTSAVKAGVFQPDGRLLGLGRASHGVQTPSPGWAQCDPEHWWRGIIKALRQACAEASVRPDELAAVGVGALFPCVLLLDEDARALHPAILYSDLRSLPQVDAIAQAVGRREYQDTIGNNLVPGTCAATSMSWLRDERPDSYAKAHAIGLANTFVTARLTGRFCTDPSHVAVSGLADIRDPWRWSEALCDRLGVDTRRLPRITGAAEVGGSVTSGAAEQTGLAPGAAVVCGGGDVLTSTVGAGGLSADTVTYIAGSTDCTALPSPRPAGGLRWCNSAYVPRGTWLGIGTTTSSGAALDWCARTLLGEQGTRGVRAMTRLAASARPGAGGVLFLPYLQGERTPVWDPRARGLFVGLSSATTRADLARAVFEGTAFALRQLMECADEVSGAPVRQIRAVGGGTANALWNQVKADALGMPLNVLDFQETGVLGAALLAGVGAGVYGSFEEAVAVAQSVGGARTFAPDPSRAALYEGLFAVYADLYPATREAMHRLAAWHP